jgi:hypothetical protein
MEIGRQEQYFNIQEESKMFDKVGEFREEERS